MIKTLTLRNWMCFRGEHIIHFEAKAYAFTALYEYDPGRSNWGGKSAIFEAANFAITGRLNKARRFSADGWITKGENEGGVRIDFFDGSSISRDRVRGHSTQVRFSNKGGKLASQDDASRELLKHLGFDEDDFTTIGYFEPKQMSRLIRTEPEKRLDIVRGWLGLEPAEKAETLASDLAKARVRELNKLRTKKTTLVGMMESNRDIPDIASLEGKLTEAKEKLELLQKQWQLHRDARGYQKIIDEYTKLVELGKTTAEKVSKIPQGLDDNYAATVEELAKKSALLEQARDDLAKKKKVSLGLFDGACPVAPIECPVKKKINSDRSASRKAFEEAKAIEENRLLEADEIKRKATKLSDLVHEAGQNRERLDTFRERWEASREEYRVAKKALKKLRKLPDESILRTEMNKWQAQHDHLIASIAQAKQTKMNIEKWTADQVHLDIDIRDESKRVQALLAAKSVFRATQRRVAEKGLNIIGARANRMLTEGGVDLSIDIRWEREGSKLAASCEMCGAAFVASNKVKECEECGTERGQHLVQKLEFLLSDRSDAADDFAGIAMQLAAGSWLLSSKDSPWGTAMIDEPFAAMDKTNRRAAANQLLQLLGSSAYKQVFVISHSQETVDVYGAQVRVIIAKDGSRRIEVV